MLFRGSIGVPEMIRRLPVTSRNLSSCVASQLPHAFSPSLYFIGAFGKWISKGRGSYKTPDGSLICNFMNNHVPKASHSLNCQIGQGGVKAILVEVNELVASAILFIKRTFQPSLLRRKRKHGFLARAATRHGRDILNRRRAKGRTSLCA